MNRRERRYGRMYLLPLLLGLTGMALLVLQWGLRVKGFDEFGALDKGGNTQDRVNFTAWYVASASTRGITCVWWDNHSFGYWIWCNYK